MSAIATIQQQHALAVPQTEAEVMLVLQNSLYPGAAPDSIRLVLSYCRAAGLDPMLKPVHIVPVYDSKARETRDVVMPGIGLYRTQAARTGQYAGMSEPVFGPTRTMQTTKINKVWKENEKGKRYCEETEVECETTYPEWCKVTVKRLLPSGVIAEFPAVEYWLENYATASRDTDAPNSMWQRRAYAQLAKCTEAQALRKAFPELGAMPTAEEMEGREVSERDVSPPPPPPEHDGRADLIATLEKVAADGEAALKSAWMGLDKAQRQMVGTTEWERIKKLSARPPVSTVRTYAQVAEAIKSADADGIRAISAEIENMPADQQKELLALCAARLGEIG